MHDTFPRDVDGRTHAILRAIADELDVHPPDLPSSVREASLGYAEEIARSLGILEPRPGTMATVTQTIGTASRDWSTIQAWEDQLDNATYYSSGDDAVGECYDDSAFTITSRILIDGGGTIGLNSRTLHAASGHEGRGQAGDGVRVVINANTFNSIIRTEVSLTVEDIEFDGANIAKTARQGAFAIASTGVVLRRVLLHDYEDTDAYTGFNWSTTTSPTLVDCIAYGASGGSATTGLFGIQSGSLLNRDASLYNCTGHNSTAKGIRIEDDASTTVKNCMITGCGTADFEPSSPASATMTHNLSEDTTASGTGSLTSEDPTELYVSTVSGAVDLHLISGAAAIGAGTDLGTTPSDVNLDIDGFDRDAAAVTWDIGADQHQGVTTTIGTTSRDYSTITLWEADFNDTAVYETGDDAIGECYDDSEFNETFTISDPGTIAIKSWHLTVASGQRHNGTEGTGARIVRTASGTVATVASGQDHTRISWLEIDMNGQPCNEILVWNNSHDGRLDHCLIHGHSSNNLWNHDGVRLNSFDESPESFMDNCIVYDIESSKATDNYGIEIIFDSFSVINCTVHRVLNSTASTGKGVYGGSGTNQELKNTISAGCDSDFDSIGVNVDEDYNCSSDATAGGVNSLTNEADSDLFVSTTAGSEDLHLKSGAAAIGAGVDYGVFPHDVNLDIDARDRDAEGDVWDMGADQFVAEPASSAMKPRSKQYSPHLAGA